MRKNRVAAKQTEISILALDDDEIMTITLLRLFLVRKKVSLALVRNQLK